MWHLPIPYSLLLKSQPQKDSNFITYSGYLPYLYEKYPKFIEETSGLFTQITLADDYSHCDSLIRYKHIFLIGVHNPYELVFIIINSLLSECIPIIFFPNGNILEFLNIDIPMDCLIILDKLDGNKLKEIDENMVYSQKINQCKRFKYRFINHEIQKVEKRLRAGLTVYYIDTGKDNTYIDNLRSIFSDFPDNIYKIKSSENNIIETIQFIFNNHRQNNYILILSDYKMLNLYKDISFSFFLDILKEYKIDSLLLEGDGKGLEILKKGMDHNISKHCYNPIHNGISKDIAIYNKACDYSFGNNTLTNDYSPNPGFRFLNNIMSFNPIRDYVGPINMMINNYDITEYDYALRYYKKGYRLFYYS